MAHRVAPQAEAELDNIWYYIAKESGTIEIAAGSLIPSPNVSISLPATRTSDAPAMRICSPDCGVFAWASMYHLLRYCVLFSQYSTQYDRSSTKLRTITKG